MFRKFGVTAFTIAILVYVLSPNFATVAHSQSGRQAGPRITQAVDESKLITLAGNTRPEAAAANDRGAVADGFAMEHMLLLLQRPPAQEQELKTFIDQLHNPNSPNFHQWLTAQEFGDRFGVAQQDLDTITWWLQSKGFSVNVIYPSGVLIDFSGTAGQVRSAFHTEIHHLNVNGAEHVANMRDPQIPAALAPAVAGIVSLNNFMPHPLLKPRANYTAPIGSSTYYMVTPADLATIYNLNPLFTAGTNGAGQTVVLIEDTNLFNTTDINTFRSTFGLTATTVTTVHPGGNCGNPGTNNADGEAALDVEYAGAAAPGATLEVAACADSVSTFGGLIAFNNLISETSPPAIYSISYGECEAAMGTTANAAYNSAYQQAVSEGLSVFVSSGDESAASCDANQANATHGIAVSGFTSTPYNVSVGGTDFGDTYAGTTTTYWNFSNTATYGSAKSYIPEIPWNDSCASVLISTLEGYSTTYGLTGFCNSTTGKNNFLTTASGSGGPSGIYAKPSWQTLVGNPSDGVRDIPDVSLFAANGVWGHFYPFCWSDTSEGGTACTGVPSGWSGAGGTSFASPILAGVQALINQKTAHKQGNPNPVYYSLAATEYGSSGSSSCNSSLGNGVGSSCIFYDVTQGDIDVNCTGTKNCYKPSGTYGVLSTSNTAYAPAYGSSTGWDFATGIGTINVANLVNNWPGATPNPSFTLAAAPSSVTITQGAGGTSSISLMALNGFTGSASLVASGLPTGVTAIFSPTNAVGGTPSILTLTAGSTATTGAASVTITGTQGSLTASTTVALTVNARAAASFTIGASPSSLIITQGGAVRTTSISLTALNGFTGAATLAATGLPSGVTAAFSPTSVASGSASTLTLTASSTAATGSATVTITGTQGNLAASTTVALTVNAAASFTLAASPTSVTVTQGASGTSSISLAALNGFTGSATLAATGLPSGLVVAFSPTSVASGSPSTLTLTASSTATTGTATITIKGTQGNLTASTTVALIVNAAPSFALAASPASVTLTQGASGGTSSISLTALNGFTGSATLAATGLPSGVTAAFNPTSAASGSPSVLTLTAGSTATTGAAATITIKGTQGSLTSSTTVTLTVKAPPSFSLSTSPNSITITQAGAVGTSSVSLAPLNGFTGNASLAATGLPSGVTAAFSPTSVTSGSASILTLTASSTATTGAATVTIKGTQGSLISSTSIALTVKVKPPASFTLAGSPSTVSIAQSGAGGTSSISLTALNGFTGNATLSVSGLPFGVAAALSSPVVTSGSPSRLTLTARSTAPTGVATVTVKGTQGSLTGSTTITLTVTAPPNFALSAAPTSLTIARSSHGTTTIPINNLNGFGSNVTLSVSGQPFGVTAAFSPNPANVNSTLTLTAGATATLGTRTLTIKGISGGLTKTTTISLTVVQ